MRKVVTTYINPDMDGIALMYAYAEFLRKKGEQYKNSNRLKWS